MTLAAAAVLSLLGSSMAGAQTATIPSTAPATTAPKSLDGKAGEAGSSFGTQTTQPATSSPPTTTAQGSPPTTTAATTTTPSTSASTTGGPPDTTATTRAPAPTVPPRSLSSGQVDEILRTQQRTGANSTAALVEALRPLQNFGMTMEEALTVGMGRFPLLGVVNWTDDWLDPRAGPPPHQHQGTDLFAAFDVPVRAPVDGIVRFEDAGLGGKGVFVTAPDGTYYYMAHLNSFARGVSSGARVTQGQIVGYNGDSGNAKGGAPHVHFEVHPRGGGAVNPKPILDGWVAEAMARVPDLIASFTPTPANGGPATGTPSDDGPPQILMTTGLTRRFTAPSVPSPVRPPAPDYNTAVLEPLTPPVLAALLVHD